MPLAPSARTLVALSPPNGIRWPRRGLWLNISSTQQFVDEPLDLSGRGELGEWTGDPIHVRGILDRQLTKV